MKVADIKGARKPVITVEPAASLSEVAATMRQHDVGALVVSAPGHPVAGLITEREIVRAIGTGASAQTVTAAQLITSPVITCSPGDRLDRVMEIMLTRKIRQLPLIEAGELVGMVSMGDVIKVLLESMQIETNVLRDLYLVATAR